MFSLKHLAGLTAPSDHLYCADQRYGSPDGEAVTIQYLGTAGFVISNSQRRIVIDPYLSRPGLPTLLSRRLTTDTRLLSRWIPKADDVLIGHAHVDHILDAPDLCKLTGARLIGSSSTIMVGRAAGLPERQLLETSGRDSIPSGPWTVRGLPSLHGQVLPGHVPFPGHITRPPPWPPRMHELRHGLVLNWVVDTGALRVMHIDSADFIPDEISREPVDVLCLCAAGWTYRPHYVRDAVSLVKPRWVLPCHWDTMITPLEAPPEQLPGIRLNAFMDEIRRAGSTPLLIPLLARREFGACTGRHEHHS
jgi:L-ascorbate metabolism protein UlaG (beta-lactamase superfamily)